MSRKSTVIARLSGLTDFFSVGDYFVSLIPLYRYIGKFALDSLPCGIGNSIRVNAQHRVPASSERDASSNDAELRGNPLIMFGLHAEQIAFVILFHWEADDTKLRTLCRARQASRRKGDTHWILRWPLLRNGSVGAQAFLERARTRRPRSPKSIKRGIAEFPMPTSPPRWD